MARNPFAFETGFAPDGGGTSPGAVAHAAAASRDGGGGPRQVLGAAEAGAIEADIAGQALAEAAVAFDAAEAESGDSFEFAFELAAPVADAVEVDAPGDLLRLILWIIRNRSTDSYTSGEGENGVVSDYNIEVVFKGTGWTDALKDTFIKASEYLSSIITGDIVDVNGIDDVRIEAEMADIDGVGGVLGQAGPTSLRGPGAGWLTAEGIMEFDVADADDYLSQGLFDDIVLHEMMHVLGIGTLWDILGLTTGSVAGGDMEYVGENAVLAYETEFGGTGDIPVETDGGAGTAGGHWDEDVFGNEIMTGYIGGVPVYVSSMTVAALEDLGYETVWDASDPSAAIPQPDDLLIG